METRDPSLRAPDPPPGSVLNGWKEIGAYVGKSPRTAIRWAEELQLPIHRMKGKSGEIVYAFREEIDGWRRRRESFEAQTEPRSTPFRAGRGPLSAAAVLVAIVAGSVALNWSSPTDRPRPESWTVLGNTLSVFDSTGEFLWERKFPFALQEGAYTAQWLPYENPGLVQIADLEGDGTREVVFVAQPLGRPDETKVYCFEHDGRERFRHMPAATVTFGDEVYGPPFTVRQLLVSLDHQGATIWIGASHLQWFPSVVQKIDPRGKVQSEYWSNGHLWALKDLHVAGRRYLMVGGTSNEDRNASLAVLDYENASGRAPASVPRYQCRTCPQIDPPYYFRFPQTELSRLVDSRPMTTEVKQQPDGGVWITVAQAPFDTPSGRKTASVHYRLNARFEVVDHRLGDDYVMAYGLLGGASRITHDFGRSHSDELLPVRIWRDGRLANSSVAAEQQ